MSTQRWLTCMLLAAASVLAACGGGGDEADTATAEDSTGKVPSSAMSSIQAFVDFVGGQAPADQAEPLSLPNATPPTSETAEPMEVS
jgi:hypothetical protein